MAIESSGEVCSISMLDGSRITIGGLFYKDDTDPGRASRTVFMSAVTEQRPCSPDQGFFLTKINKRVTECSKQAVYSSQYNKFSPILETFGSSWHCHLDSLVLF